MHHDFLVFMFGEFIDMLTYRAKRDQLRSKVEFFVFVWFAHVDEDKFFACFQFLAKFLYGDIHGEM